MKRHGDALAKLGKLLYQRRFFTWALEKFGFSLADVKTSSTDAAVLKAIFTQPFSS